MPCPYTTQSATRRKRRQRSPSEATPSSRILLKDRDAKMMAIASTPARSRHGSQEDAASPNRSPSHPASRVASPQLNATVRFPPSDALRLFSSSGARDAISLAAVARQITSASTTPSASTSQSSLFVALRPSQAGSTCDVADRASPRLRRPSPFPSRTHSSRSSDRAEHAGEVLLQMFAHFSWQVTAQLAAQSTALSSVMQRFETLHTAISPRRSRRLARRQIAASRLPSQRASPSPQRSSHRQSALDASAFHGVTFPFSARPLAQDPYSTANQLAFSARAASPVPLGAAQHSH